MVQYQFLLPNLPGFRALMSLFGHGLPVTVGEQHYDDGSSWTGINPALQYGNGVTECGHQTDLQTGSPPSSDDARLLGISVKSTRLHQHSMSSFIEKR